MAQKATLSVLDEDTDSYMQVDHIFISGLECSTPGGYSSDSEPNTEIQNVTFQVEPVDDSIVTGQPFQSSSLSGNWNSPNYHAGQLQDCDPLKDNSNLSAMVFTPKNCVEF